MDYESIIEITENKVAINNVKNFELSHIFDCGQCFRWNRQENNNYIGIAYGRVIEVEKKDDNLIIYNTTLNDVKNIWLDYFDLNREYSEIKKELSKDSLLKTAVEFGNGIRLLKQEPFEIIISFIISSNNRIPMIKRCIENLSKSYGKVTEYKGKEYYLFPSIQDFSKLSKEELESNGTGFRGKYIKETVGKIEENISSENDEKNINNEYKYYNIEWIKAQNDDICHKELMKFMGIGPKVADCIMLFSMSKYSAFPVDVWVKRAMQHFYLAPDVSLPKIREFGREKFGDLSGFAQQYLFYHARENNILM